MTRQRRSPPPGAPPTPPAPAQRSSVALRHSWTNPDRATLLSTPPPSARPPAPDPGSPPLPPQNQSGSSAPDVSDVAARLAPRMASGSQLGGGGGATMQRGGLDLQQKAVVQGPKLADGGGGGNSGNFVNFGGGGGGDSDDDDDFFGGGDEDGDGDGSGGNNWFRAATAELFDMGAVNAVLGEWGYTVASLPAFFRAGAGLFLTGAFSSANLVRFAAGDHRPTLARALYERLPYGMARGLVGRLMADPALAQKAAVDALGSAALALWWEGKQRGDCFAEEMDIALANSCIVGALSAALVYCLAPARVASAARAPWQEALAAVPNNVFEAGSATRTFSLGGRAAALGVKAGQLAALGAGAGAMQWGVGTALAGLRGGDAPWTPSVPVPELGRAVAGGALFCGVSSNLRYQALAGADRYLLERAAAVGPAVAASTAARLGSSLLGQPQRLWAAGLPASLPAEVPGYEWAGRGRYRRTGSKARGATGRGPVAALMRSLGLGGAPAGRSSPKGRRSGSSRARRSSGSSASASASAPAAAAPAAAASYSAVADARATVPADLPAAAAPSVPAPSESRDRTQG